MKVDDFAPLGDHAAAGHAATRLALEAGAASGAAGRIPISGAAVARRHDGSLETVCVGVNGRIPADGGAGYPTDHGETGAIRGIEDAGAVDWADVVFATTLSPCIMCTRTLMHLHGRGLRRLVIAESQSFAGRKDLLRPLPGMQIVELSHPPAVDMMQRFARRYPWDWAADIGEVPPASGIDGLDPAAMLDALSQAGADAGVFEPTGRLIAEARDGRAATGGNPVYSAAMLAMGRAGSAVNLREHVLVIGHPGTIDLAAFGASSLGACELFRPAAVVTRGPVSADLRAQLEVAGVRTLSLG
jgi:tRNA(Arg) A34 adenosine deaminase TadA